MATHEQSMQLNEYTDLQAWSKHAVNPDKGGGAFLTNMFNLL